MFKHYYLNSQELVLLTPAPNQPRAQPLNASLVKLSITYGSWLTKMSEGASEKFQMTNLTVPSNFCFMKYCSRPET